MAEAGAEAEAGGVGVDLVAVSPEVVAWVQLQLDNEVKRLNASDQRCIPLKVLNFAQVRCEVPKESWGQDHPADGTAPPPAPPSERELVLSNRVEFGTSFDFGKVVQICLSEPVDCPVKAPFRLVLLILLAAKSRLPLLAPYLYNPEIEGSAFHHWVLVNNKGEGVHHFIRNFDMQLASRPS